MSDAKTDRNQRILTLRSEGKSFNEIARTLLLEGEEPISAQRVKQIVDARYQAKENERDRR